MRCFACEGFLVRRGAVRALLFLAIGCGGKAKRTTLHIDSGGAGNIDSSSGAAGNEQAGADGGTTGSGGSPGVPPEVLDECSRYVDYVRAYAAEEQASDGEGSPEPQPGMGNGTIGPCGACLGACSREIVPGCENHSYCVARHCSCEGCEDLPGGDFCSCVETCNGPQDDECLAAWVDYAVCVSQSCAGTCPGS
jgi:hypothetical protein